VQNGSSETSIEKARGAVMFKRPTKLFEDVVLGGKINYLKLPESIPLEGGLPILVDGKIGGAIGVSGATSAQDGQCARAGAEAVSPAAK
jgi:glc operon protein GlcG